MVTFAEWNTLGNCRHGDPERLFVTGAKQREARTICRGCPVLKQCLAMALDERIEYGVWGGKTERERRAMLKACPDIGSWTGFLDRLEIAARRGTSTTVPATRPVSVPAATKPVAPVALLSPPHRPGTAPVVPTARPLPGAAPPLSDDAAPPLSHAA